MEKQPRSVLSFDGADDLVEITRKNEHKIPREITMEAWVYVTGRTHYAGIISRVFDTGSTESGYGLLLDNVGGFYCSLKVAGQGQLYLSSGPNTLPSNDWHHVAATWDGQVVTLYVDGEKKATYAVVGTGLAYDPDHNLTLGAYKDNDERYCYGGKLAEVRLWSVARSGQQIAESMRSALKGDEPGLVGYWPLDEGRGDGVADKAKQGCAGKLAGATWETTQVPFSGRSDSAPASGPNSGTFNTMEVRPWNEPRAANSKEISFARQLPGIAIGLTSVDMSCAANVRIKSYADHITYQGFQLHLDAWADTTLYSAGCSWLEVAPDETTFQFGTFNTMEDHPWNQPQAKTSRKISFSRPFSAPPKVVVWINGFDMSNAHGWRLKIAASDVTATGFTIHIDTWADSILYFAGATWIAFAADRTDVTCDSFNTQEIRPWDRPQHNHAKQVSYKGAAFAKPPRVLLGLDSIDFDYRRNLRVNLTADAITTTGLSWQLNSWSDTVMYSAGGSYLAIGAPAVPGGLLRG